MFRKILAGLAATAMLTTPAFAQNSSSGSPRVQGVPAGYGDPVQVTIRNTDGSAPGAMGSVTVSSSALPTGASTSAAQTTAATSNGAPGDTACATDTASCSANAQRQRIAQRLTTINTTLGTPFQAGGSIANTTFAATQSGTWNIGTVTTLPALPANQSSNIAQINAITPLMGNGVTGTGSLRVTIASDTTSNTNPLLINQSQVNGVAMLAGNGVTGTGSQRVTIASDNTAFSVNAVQSGTWNTATLTTLTGGGVASGATDSGNPIKVGARYNSTLPTLTDGQRGDLQIGTRGALAVTFFAQNTATSISDATGGLWAQGAVADAAADSGNPVKIGGVVRTTLGGALTAATRQSLRLNTYGQLMTSSIYLPTIADAITNASIGGELDFAGNIGYHANGLLGFNSSTWDRIPGNVNGLVVQPALSTTFWNYAAASGGIVNTTTAVTIKAAAGASVRNYLCTLQYEHDPLGGQTEWAVRDGAAGTVLARGRLLVNGVETKTVVFNPCLRGTANTLMEFVTLTATITGGLYVNAQGYTGN